jgi:chromosome partitioning protein
VAKVISLLNMKGGVGKTTLAVNLAWHLHQNNQANVLLVDFDPQFNATQYVLDFKTFETHRKMQGTIADLLIDQPKLTVKTQSKIVANPSLAVHTVKTTHGKKFDLLPSELHLSRVVKNPSQMDYRLEKILGKLSPKYDFVLIDCAPTDSVLTTMALTASDQVLIPVRPDRFSILGLTNLLETVDGFRKNCQNPHSVQILGMVFTQVQGNSPVEETLMQEIAAVAKTEGVYLFANRLLSSKSFIRSVNDQTPIFETAYAKPKSRIAVGKIADEVKSRLAVQPVPVQKAKKK